MTTTWVVTTPSDRIDLDESQQGQITFTVTNPGKRVDRAVLDVVAGDGADTAWFTVDEPQRRVPASGSVSYLMKAAVPTTAKPGTYAVQARVYSADSAPEEDSVLSNRLVVEVKPKAAPPVVKKKIPWWVYVVIALVVVVAVVVSIIVGTRGGTPAPKPGATGPVVTMPDLTHQSEAQARTNLVAFGLTVGTIRHKFDATPDQVLYQSVAGGAQVTKGTPVDLVITVTAALPVLKAPPNPVPVAAIRPPVTAVPVTPVLASGSPAPPASPSASGGAPASTGLFAWTDPQAFVHRWMFYVTQQYCGISVISPVQPAVQGCFNQALSVTPVDQPAYTPILPVSAHIGVPGVSYDANGVYLWTVAPVDDFGNVGPAATPSGFQVR